MCEFSGEDMKVVQELMRHANSKITLDTYIEALSPAKRKAQIKVAEMILPKKQVREVTPSGDASR